MAFLDRFRKKRGDKGNKRSKGKKEQNVLDLVQESTPTIASEDKPKALKDNTGLAHRILKHHHLSEKTNTFSTTGRYVFIVSPAANKIEVKKAVEKVYDVHVTKVNIVNVLGKSRRQGRISGRTSDWKKAIVTLKAGEKISGLAQGV
jgi:large subunit ribosomal protein L23